MFYHSCNTHVYGILAGALQCCKNTSRVLVSEPNLHILVSTNWSAGSTMTLADLQDMFLVHADTNCQTFQL